MKSKLILMILFIGMAILLAGMAGCSKHYTTITYHNPTWHPNGKILAARSVYEYDTMLDYPGTVKNEKGAVYLTEIEIDNNNDYVGERDLFGLDSGSYEIKICASPDGNYVMYHAFEGVGNPSVIRIVKYPNGEKVNDIYWNENINSFDWGPDSDRIVFTTTDTKKMYILKKDGTGTFEVTGSAEAVAWRVGEKIAYSFADYESSKVYVISADSSSKEVIASVGSRPQILQTNGIVYAGYGYKIESVEADGSNKLILIDDYPVTSLKLSFDDTKIAGGDWTQSGIVGIWVIDINGNNEKQIK